MRTEWKRQKLFKKILVQRINAPLFILAMDWREDTERLALLLDLQLIRCFTLGDSRKEEPPIPECRLQSLHAVCLAARPFTRPRQFVNVEYILVALHFHVEVFKVGCAAISLITDLDRLHAGHVHPVFAHGLDRRVSLAQAHLVMVSIDQPEISGGIHRYRRDGGLVAALLLGTGRVAQDVDVQRRRTHILEA